jgi:hypothetical protein
MDQTNVKVRQEGDGQQKTRDWEGCIAWLREDLANDELA